MGPNGLAGSAQLWLCSTLWSSPPLHTIWSRAEANTFLGGRRARAGDREFDGRVLAPMRATRAKPSLSSSSTAVHLATPGPTWGGPESPEKELKLRARRAASFTPHVESQAGIERYNVMIQMSTHPKFLPPFTTHLDLQVGVLMPLFQVVSHCIASHRIPPPPLPSPHPSSPGRAPCLASPPLTYLQLSLLLSPPVPTASKRIPSPPASAFLHPFSTAAAPRWQFVHTVALL